MLTKTKHVLVFVVVAVAIIITNSGLPKRFTELPGEDEVVNTFTSIMERSFHTTILAHFITTKSR